MHSMNTTQLKLWEDLSLLVKNNEAFYFVDQELDNLWYRIFSYRLASYTDFLAPGAIECRGIMFEIEKFEDGGVEPYRLASMPMQKFWNLNENPNTMNLDLSKVKEMTLKADGSLISTYLHNGELRLKSKTSLFSDQAVAAMKWLDKSENASLKRDLLHLCFDDSVGNCTVNMEWCAPDNRIVIGYLNPHLIILNVRDNLTGLYIDTATIFKKYWDLAEFWITKVIPNPDRETYAEFVARIPTMTDVEGFVVELASGQLVKIKTEWYLVQHRAKDSINSPRRLFETVVEEATDDLRTLFATDPLVIKMIEEMELKVDKIYNHLVSTVEKFYEANKNLDRKEYAILGQKELDRLYFSLAMNKYLKKADSYKDFMKKHYKDFGIKDEVKEEE